jgi:hypothetical protein
VQVSVPLDKSAALAQVTGCSRQLRVLAVPDHSPKTAKGAHPVFKFESFADVAGQAIKAPDGEPGETTIKGVVQSWQFARQGEPNGVILEAGEFSHLRPHGLVAAGLGHRLQGPCSRRVAHDRSRHARAGSAPRQSRRSGVGRRGASPVTLPTYFISHGGGPLAMDEG